MWGVTQGSGALELRRGKTRSQQSRSWGGEEGRCSRTVSASDPQCLRKAKAGPCAKHFLITVTPGGRPSCHPQFTERKLRLREAGL